LLQTHELIRELMKGELYSSNQANNVWETLN